MGNVQRDTKSCKYTPEKQQNEKRQWQKQHFYQESQNDGNQKQRENYSFQNIRWKSSDKPERHKERTTTKLQNNPETKWHEYKDAQKWDRLPCRDTTVRGEGLLHVWDEVSWLHLLQSGHMIFLRAGQNSTSSTTRQTFLPQYVGMCDQSHCTHTVHTHSHFSLPSFCGSIAVTAGKSSRSRKHRHFQLSGGLKAGRPGNDAAGRKSTPVSRHGSHAATPLWSERQ